MSSQTGPIEHLKYALEWALEWAEQQYRDADSEAERRPLYIPRDAPPHVALQAIRDYLYSASAHREDRVVALVLVSLDRVLAQLKGYGVRVAYERHEAPAGKLGEFLGGQRT
jgi:hypothetical protein